MERTNCIICSSDQKKDLLQLNDRLGTTSDLFFLKKCECGFIYLDPRPDCNEITSYYTSNSYEPHSRSRYLRKVIYNLIQKITFKRKYNIITKYNKTGSILDIGGGRGEFANYMENNNWSVCLQDSVVDHDYRENNISFAKYLSEFNKCKIYDVITLWHSLEHIHNIEDLFDNINRLIKDSGTLLIAVPNLSAPERLFYKQNWAPYDAPRHLYHFNLDSLELLCNKYKFEIIQKYSFFQDLPYNILLSMPNYTPYQIIKAIVITTYSFILNFIYGPEYSSSILVVCKKR